MNTLATFWKRLRSLFGKTTLKGEIDEELRFHLEQRMTDNIAAGMSPEEAARNARRRFGGVLNIREECRQARGADFGESLIRDVQFGLRVLVKNPAFALVSVLSLTVGIAANVVVFSCLNAALFRAPAGVRNPERLVHLQEMVGGVSHGEFEFLRDHSADFSALAASASCRRGVRLKAGHDLGYPGVRFVSANYFSLLGEPLAQGRPFLPEADQPGSRIVAVVSQNLWKHGFESDPDLVGKTVSLNKTACTIVGIAPASYPREPGVFVPTDIWLTFAAQKELDPDPPSKPNADTSRQVQFIGRLRSGVNAAQGESELRFLDDQFARQYPDSKKDRFHWTSYLETGFGFLPWRPWQMKALVLLTLSVSGAVLLIACANVASLLLARATARQRELGVRLALGASRLRVVRQLLTESLIIACVGGMLGLVSGTLISNLVWNKLANDVLPPGLAESFNYGLDWRVVCYALFLTLVTGVVFGLAPALEAVKSSVNSALKQESNVLGRRLARSRLRSALIVAQVAVSLTFLIGTTLMLRRVQTGIVRQYGFDTQNIMMLDFSTPAQNPSHFQPALIRLLSGIPGVKSASIGRVWYARYLDYHAIRVDGQMPQSAAGIALSRVTPDYFGTLGISFVHGRNFTQEEAKAEAPLLIVSESFAKRFWPGLDPIGHRFKINTTNTEAVVIGVVKDGVREIRSQYEMQPYSGDFYEALSPDTSEKCETWVRTAGNPYGIMPALRRQMPSLDDTVNFSGRRLSDIAATWVGPMLFMATTVGVLGFLALVLASVGVYGVVSYSVKQRTQEIGIRMALGAQRAALLRLLLWEGMRLVSIGMAIGLMGSACLSTVLRSYFYGLSPLDPVTFLTVSLLLALAGVLACFFPARRAASVDPMSALRYE